VAKKTTLGDLEMSAVIPQGQGATEASGGALDRKGLGWALFEWARNPYYNVVVIYVFAPYFAASVVNNGSMGQTLVSLTITIAGVIMAFIAPILGTIVDKAGAKKPFIFISLGIMGIASILLGFITPDLPGAIPLGMFLMVVGYCCYSVSELLHNAMLPGAGASKSLPLISGLGLSLGNLAGVITLILVLIASQIGLFGLTGEDISRLSAPTIAIWLFVFIGFFFLMMPDVYRPNATWKAAFKEARDPANRVHPLTWIKSKFKAHPNVMRYLVGRMIYADGVAALLTIGGVYVTGVLGWSIAQLTVLGIIGSIFAVLGGFVGGMLDRTFGPKRALMIELSVVILLGIVQLSITPEFILFGLIPAGHTVWEGGIYPLFSDIVYISILIPSAIFLVASIASSRYMLVHICPKDQVGEFFGFYAMAGSVTVWIGPGLVGLVTFLTSNQRLGFASVMFLLITGLIIISTVKADKIPEHMKDGST
jgi:UMF1 family MFS transporter